VQDVLRAVAAPGALVTADIHVRGCRVEIPVTAFAIRPQLQHMTSIDRQPRLEQASIPVSMAVASRPGCQANDVMYDAVGKHSFRRCKGSLTPGGIYLATDGWRNVARSLLTSRTRYRRVV
jgi:hypothetical protein